MIVVGGRNKLLDQGILPALEKDNALHSVQEVRNKILEIDGTVGKMHIEMQEMKIQVSELSAEKEASMGGEIKLLSDKDDVLSQDLVKETSVLKNQEDNLTVEKQHATKIEESLGESNLVAKERATAIKNAEEGAFDLKKSFEELSKSWDEHEKEYQGVVAGKSSRDEDKCLEDQMGDAKICCCQLSSALEEATAIENELNVTKKEVDKVKNSLKSLSYDENIWTHYK
ncbi:hypothetical protein OROMI_018911 [Orobanche minor]